MRDLLSLNRLYLLQADQLIESLDDDTFCQAHCECHGASLGQHLRHCIEHYLCLLNQMGEAKIDYDLRPRDPEIECSTTASREAISKVLELLAKATNDWPESTPVQVHMDCGDGECSDIGWQPSSVGRELQSLVSHTVHHFAIISIMCQKMGIPLHPDFGVAPSTLRHWNKDKELAAR